MRGGAGGDKATHNMGDCLFAVDGSLHDTILVDTDCCKQIQCVFVARINTVENKADNNLLPGRSTFVPELGTLEIDDVPNIFHDAMQGACCQDFVFVVIGNGNQQFSMAIVHRRTEIVTILESEVIGIASGGSICLGN